jgi:hypothetical protein
MTTWEHLHFDGPFRNVETFFPHVDSLPQEHHGDRNGEGQRQSGEQEITTTIREDFQLTIIPPLGLTVGNNPGPPPHPALPAEPISYTPL